jgi:hypothetical protein
VQFPPSGYPELEAALSSSSRVITTLLEADWNRDNNFTHAYSDLSLLATSVQDNRQIQGDLPIELSATTGFSSGELTVTLAGKRGIDELMANRLLSPYATDSPLYTFIKEGTPIRWSRIVETTSGSQTIRQFTGWIRSYIVDDLTGEVFLTCSDVYDLMSRQTTLPLWAMGPTADDTYQYSASGEISMMRPIDTTWVYEEVLRDAGRPTGPSPRPDAIAYWTCNGSMLPSIGTMSDLNHSWHGILYDPVDAWENGQYGIQQKGAFWTDWSTYPVNYARSISRPVVPSNGTADGPTYIGTSFWMKSDAAASPIGTTFDWSIIRCNIDYDQVPDDRYVGCMVVYAKANGTLEVRVYDDGGTGISFDNHWIWKYDATRSGENYVDVRLSFTNSSISISTRINGSVVTPTTSTTVARGFIYNGITFPSNIAGSAVELNPQSTPIQHVQIYTGTGSGSYITNQDKPFWYGSEPPAVVERSMTELSWLPDTQNRLAWDVLREAVSAEFGVIYTTESGQLRIVRRDTVWYGTGVSTANAYPLPASKVKNVQLNPSADTYRNTVSISSSNRIQERAIVWQPGDPKQFFAKSISNPQPGPRTYALSEVVAIQPVTTYNRAPHVDIPNGPPLDQTTVAAISSSNLAYNNSGWVFVVYPDYNQRQLQVAWAGGVGDVYVGAKADGNQTELAIGGLRYSSKDVKRGSFVDSSEVAVRGTYLLELPDSDWRQTVAVQEVLADSLLRDLVTQAPTIRNVSIPADPRIQLLDVVSVDTISAGSVFAQVIGIQRSDTKDTSEDNLTLRVIFTPAEWELGVTGLSELGTTTILG